MRSGFFNSEIIGYDAENMPVFDRAEEASFFAKYFSQFISNGVFPNPSTNMQVLATEGMQVKVSIGVCYINGYMGWVEPAETLEIEESDARSRIDRIVARLDFTDRSIKLFVKKGTASGNPVAPELQRDYDIYEIGLADVRVNANAIEITQENITDLRLNTELCGIVANHLQHLDTTTLFNQYQDWLNRVTNEAETDLAEKKQEMETRFNNIIAGFSQNFDEWFQDVQTTLSGDVAGNLLVKINNIDERVKVLEKRIYGVRRNIETPDTTWERIEDSVGLTANATHDGTVVQNDFDNIYPWSDIISCDVSADGTINSYYGDPDFSFENPQGYIMTKFPEFWWKREQKDGYEYIYISKTEEKGFRKSESFMMSRYAIGGTKEELNCKSGVEYIIGANTSEIRESAKAIGNNWYVLDMVRWSMIQLLYLVEYADYDSAKILGAGLFHVNNKNIIKNGVCDSLGMKSGSLTSDKLEGDSPNEPVIYRGIENIFRIGFLFLDGVILYLGVETTAIWISRNPENNIEPPRNALEVEYENYEKLSYNPPMGSGR